MKCKALTEDEVQLVDRLKNWNEQDCILLAAIQEAVGPNTFRAFPRLPQRPSEVFRDWARKWLMGPKGFQDLLGLTSVEEYDEWLRLGVNKLRKQWRQSMGEELGIGPAYKLANLLLKRISRELTPKQRVKLFEWLHVPLDRHTLNTIRTVVVLPRGRTIDANATMGHVQNIRDYKCIQQTIRRLAECAKVPPIAFDYIAFNAR